MENVKQELARAKVIAHIDLVEASLHKQLKGKPLVVVQYNPAKDNPTLPPEANRLLPSANNSIIAVSYEARKFGIKRNMMGQEARKLCPDLYMIQVPVAHGKADLTIYRDASAQIVSILSGTGCICEKASIDEVYLDVTEAATARLTQLRDDEVPMPASFEGMHVEGQDSTPQQDQAAEGVSPAAAVAEAWWRRPVDTWQPHERLLAAGAQVVQELRMAVYSQLGFTCSAGVSHYKILAKLGSGLHKPAQQTLVPAAAVQRLLRDLPLSKLRGLGGEFGKQVQQATGATTCGELWAVPVSRLEALFGNKRGVWLSRLVWGLESEAEVKQRLVPKQISCAKTFRGARALTDLDSVRHWMCELAGEVWDRCVTDRQANQRIPTSLSVGLTDHPAGGVDTNHTRSYGLGKLSSEGMTRAAMQLIKTWATGRSGWRITVMSLTVAKFVHAPTGPSITAFAAPTPTINNNTITATTPTITTTNTCSAASKPGPSRLPMPGGVVRAHEAVQSPSGHQLTGGTPGKVQGDVQQGASPRSTSTVVQAVPQPAIKCLKLPASLSDWHSHHHQQQQQQQQQQQLQEEAAAEEEVHHHHQQQQQGEGPGAHSPVFDLQGNGSELSDGDEQQARVGAGGEAIGQGSHVGHEVGSGQADLQAQQAGHGDDGGGGGGEGSGGDGDGGGGLTEVAGGTVEAGHTCTSTRVGRSVVGLPGQAQEQQLAVSVDVAPSFSQGAATSSQLPASLSEWLPVHQGSQSQSQLVNAGSAASEGPACHASVRPAVCGSQPAASRPVLRTQGARGTQGVAGSVPGSGSESGWQQVRGQSVSESGWQQVRGIDVDPEVLQQLPPEVRQEYEARLLLPAFRLSSSTAAGGVAPHSQSSKADAAAARKRNRRDEPQAGGQQRPHKVPTITAFYRPKGGT